MQTMTVQKAGDIESSAREWLQRLFGRSLREDEEIAILLFAPVPAPDANERRVAFQQIEKVLDKAAENMRNVPDDEFDEALDEAIQHVRRRNS